MRTYHYLDFHYDLEEHAWKWEVEVTEPGKYEYIAKDGQIHVKDFCRGERVQGQMKEHYNKVLKVTE